MGAPPKKNLPGAAMVMEQLDQPLLAAGAATAAAGTARLSPKPFIEVCFSATPPPWPVKLTGGNADLIPPPAPEADKAAPPGDLPPEEDPEDIQKPESKSAYWPTLAWIILVGPPSEDHRPP